MDLSYTDEDENFRRALCVSTSGSKITVRLTTRPSQAPNTGSPTQASAPPFSRQALTGVMPSNPASEHWSAVAAPKAWSHTCGFDMNPCRGESGLAGSGCDSTADVVVVVVVVAVAAAVEP